MNRRVSGIQVINMDLTSFRLGLCLFSSILQCNTLFSREEIFAKSEFEIFSREYFFANILFTRKYLPRKYLPAKIYSRENIFPRKNLPANCFRAAICRLVDLGYRDTYLIRLCATVSPSSCSITNWTFVSFVLFASLFLVVQNQL